MHWDVGVNPNPILTLILIYPIIDRNGVLSINLAFAACTMTNAGSTAALSGRRRSVSWALLVLPLETTWRTTICAWTAGGEIYALLAP
ncbi:hypothetical protein L208DRAFT_1395384 [Tricholoma matsutake]|nr:hypothetical protein L208DRAFT_1395384 [Tricholoma matsutake 945]